MWGFGGWWECGVLWLAVVVVLLLLMVELFLMWGWAWATDGWAECFGALLGTQSRGLEGNSCLGTQQISGRWRTSLHSLHCGLSSS